MYLDTGTACQAANQTHKHKYCTVEVSVSCFHKSTPKPGYVHQENGELLGEALPRPLSKAESFCVNGKWGAADVLLGSPVVSFSLAYFLHACAQIWIESDKRHARTFVMHTTCLTSDTFHNTRLANRRATLLQVGGSYGSCAMSQAPASHARFECPLCTPFGTGWERMDTMGQHKGLAEISRKPCSSPCLCGPCAPPTGYML